MIIRNQLSSKPYNTFGIDVPIQTFIEIKDRGDLHLLRDALKDKSPKIIGGGSNILLTKSIEEPVLLINTVGIKVIKEEPEYSLVQFEAGVPWVEAVGWAVSQGLGGIENLALIPGKCGAAPMQNIGAYGVEIKDVLHAVTAYKLSDGMDYTFHNVECNFGYRTSNFKTIWKDQYIVLDIILKLTKEGHHQINTSYGAISTSLKERKIETPAISDIKDIVEDIRRSKLPDPKLIGNAGSFFKNPIIGSTQYASLKALYPNLPSYPVDDQRVKVPAAWLIDQCGWKGKVIGQTGTYKNQALVIVNHGKAKGQEVYDLSSAIKTSVEEKFGVVLEREVNVW